MRERINKNGEILVKLNELEAEKIIKQLDKEGVKSVAVCLLHSYANTDHEKKIGKLIAKKFPHLNYSLSSEVMPEIREYERASATVMNAYVQPLADQYLKKLKVKLNILGFEGIIHIMNSAGRLTTIEGARKTRFTSNITKFPVGHYCPSPTRRAFVGFFVDILVELAYRGIGFKRILEEIIGINVI